MEFNRSRGAKPVVEVRPGRAMQALGELLREPDLSPFALLDAALELLSRQFMVDQAMIARLSEKNLEAFWWVGAGTGAKVPPEVLHGLKLCERVLQAPEGQLILGSVFEEEGGPGIQAFAGVVLREGGHAIGTLAVLCRHPFAFCEGDIEFIRSVAGLLERALEIENLRYQLKVAQDSLALSAAVAQDSSLEGPSTGLPNGRFLEVWMKGHMPRARRRKETLCVAIWEWEGKAPGVATIRKVAQGLRGEDLLVELGPSRLLLLLPQTLQEGGNVLLERLAKKLGNPPMGATLWLPERDDLQLGGALRRAERARLEAVKEHGGIKWKLPAVPD
ncbi:MAG TPA: GAF domain-containing protein [Holophaga sp.]|nr:GAF domain-containing protein [Holophaga sp.]